jgi:hypothetical protein
METESKTIVVNLRSEPYDIYIGRGSCWGNPYRIGPDGTRAQVIQKYRAYLMRNANLLSRLEELRGKRLGCFCAPRACHGDVLVELLEGTHDTSTALPFLWRNRIGTV